MDSVIAFVLAILITIPIVGWFLLYIVTVKITKKKAYSVKLASDLSAVIFILSVYFIMYEIWHESFLWLIAIIFLSVASVYTFIYWKISEDLHIGTLLRGIWRFNFLFFFVLYFALSIYGLVVKMLI